jgi:hypothetical protein
VDENKLLNAILNAPWDVVFADIQNIDTLYNAWFDCFRDVLMTRVPNKTVVIRPRDKPWMNSEVRRAVRKRNRLLKKFCANKNPENWELYRRQRNNTTTLIRKSKISFYNKLNNKLNDVLLGPKKWWGIVKQLYGSKIQSSVPALLENNCIITDAKEKATLLNEYFSSQCKIPDLDATIPNTRVFQSSKPLGKITM